MLSDPGPGYQPEPPIEAAFRLNRTALLTDLLVNLFSSAASMRAFVRKYEGMEKLDGDLPGENVPAATMASALVMSRALAPGPATIH